MHCKNGAARLALSLRARSQHWLKIKNPAAPAVKLGVAKTDARAMALKAHDPEYWRKRAEEARAVAVPMMDAHAKAIMLSIAQDQRGIELQSLIGPTHAPVRAARTLAAEALLERIWDFWFPAS
jgi:hypothetical protein